MRDVTVGTARGIGRIFTPAGVERYSKHFTTDAPEEGSPADLERPRSLIGIVDEGSSIVAGNFWALLWLLGAISLVLALFNLLPLLPFDGGHAVVVVYEAIASRVRGRTVRVDFRKLMPVTAVVLAIFVTLGVSAMALDIRDLAR
jgi:membrane-associated protease RseP (regulator of RpoE activity)